VTALLSALPEEEVERMRSDPPLILRESLERGVDL